MICPRCHGPLKRSVKRIPGHVVLGCLACKIACIDERWPDWLSTTDPNLLDKLQGVADTIDAWQQYVAMTLADEDWD